MYKRYYIRFSEKAIVVLAISGLFASIQSRLYHKIVHMNKKTSAESLNYLAASGNKMKCKTMFHQVIHHFSLTSNPSLS